MEYVTPAVALAVHPRLICEDDIAVATRPDGAPGATAANVVALAEFDAGEDPADETAITVNEYKVLAVSPVTESLVVANPIAIATEPLNTV